MALTLPLWHRVFGKRQPQQERQLPSFFHEQSGHAQPKTTPEVLRQLRLWQRQRQLIEVKTARQGEYQQSLILAVNPEQMSFDIDELFPSQYHGQIQTGDSLHLRLNQAGTVKEMECKVLAYHHHSAMPYYSLRIPETIHCGQRRKQRRISVDEDFPITISLQTPVGQMLYGSAENISAGGLRLRLAGNQLKELYPGAMLPLCELSFPGGLNIRCRAKVKGLQFLRQPHRHTQISLIFSDLAHEQRQQIEGLIDVIYQRCQFAA